MGKRTDEYVSGRINTVIGKGTTFEGTLHTREIVRIEGFVKGDIISEGTLIIGREGKVEGKIEAVNILVGGEVRGELIASGKLEANSSGRIYGNIHTKSLIVDENAVFQGTCEMVGKNVPDDEPATGDESKDEEQ